MMIPKAEQTHWLREEPGDFVEDIRGGFRMWHRVIGQRRVKDMLLAARRSGRMPHAYLFFGGDGVGKDAMALELARVLRCERGGDEACDECSSCRRIAMLQHPDVRFIVALPTGKGEKADDEPLAKLTEAEVRSIQEQLRTKAENPYHRILIPRANVIKINSIREVRRESSMMTSDRLTRIFIISQAESMEAPAANTLLKTLEEPPGDTMLILTTAHREALLPTMLSRCQNVRFDLLTAEDIAAALLERNGVAGEQATLVSRLANGSYARALELLDEDVMGEREEVVAFIRRALGRDMSDPIGRIEKIHDAKDRTVAARFLALMLMWFRDAFVLTNGGAIINVDQQDTLTSFVAKFPHADLVSAMAEVEKAISLVERYGYIKLVLLRLTIQLRKAIVSGPRPPLPSS